METQVNNDRLIVDGSEYRFSSHLAAFEACMRLTDPDWKPHGNMTYFAVGDVETFEGIPK